MDYSVPPCRRRAPLICAFRTRGFSSGLALVAGWIASASAHRRRCNATCKLNATLAEIEIDRSVRDDGHRSHPGRSVACHVQRCFLHAWCPTDADLEFAVRPNVPMSTRRHGTGSGEASVIINMMHSSRNLQNFVAINDEYKLS